MSTNRYNELAGMRDMFGMRCNQYAAWTLAGILPTKDQTYTNWEIQHDFQSTGAAGVICLSNKLSMVLFHPSNPFFKLSVNEKEKAKLPGMSEADLDSALSKVERQSMDIFNSGNWRGKMLEVLQLAIITGDVVLKLTDDGVIVYHIHEYVRELSVDGSLNLLIIKERKLPRNFPPKIKKKMVDSGIDCSDTVIQPVVVYTVVERVANTLRWNVHQEIDGVGKITDKDGNYGVNDLPFINVYWHRYGRDNYGRGLVEAHAGDFAQLSNVSESISDLTVILANILFLVKPEAVTDPKILEGKESGSFVPGNPEDISCFMADVKVQLETLLQNQNALERKLGSAFLLNSAVTRDAERVTAEEIRQQAKELEATLGGVYTNLSFLLQYPIAVRLVSQIDSAYSKLKVTILTGLEALSRYSDLENWKRLITDLANMSNIPPEASMWIKYEALIKILAAGYGLDYQTILKSKDEYDKDKQASMQEQQQHQAALEQGKAQAKGEIDGG